ncbi:hypothetical protein NDU88_005262 [Pleurodeles waltl]|uniref:Uncharacterized protein n=1 Tax=Pleurodeles waltl TaxID=8319 RepID=A0AAV7QEA3_PLEWA|nr:hypothetical protein NDU88_005262 [Pleurodeles waltl]
MTTDLRPLNFIISTVTMSQQEEYYGEYSEGHQMEERLVEALDFHVQDSVNRALVKALRPFARFGAGSGNPTPNEVKINEPGRADSDPFEHTINALLNDHEYSAFFDQGSDPTPLTKKAREIMLELRGGIIYGFVMSHRGINCVGLKLVSHMLE